MVWLAPHAKEPPPALSSLSHLETHDTLSRRPVPSFHKLRWGGGAFEGIIDELMTGRTMRPHNRAASAARYYVVRGER